MGLPGRPRRFLALAAPLLVLLLLLVIVGAASGERQQSSDCTGINVDGNDTTLRFPQYTPREEVCTCLHVWS